MRHISEEMARSELYAQAFFSSDLERALIKGLIPAQPNNYSEALQQGLGGRPPHYLLRAREFLQANARETLSLEDVERAAGVSRFKLFEGFRRYFGVSPMSYLKHYRLAAVREEILASGGACSISDDRPGLGLQPPRTLLRGLPQALRGNPEHDPAPRCAALPRGHSRRPRGRSAPGSAAGAGSRRPGAG